MKDHASHLTRKCLPVDGIANLDFDREKSTGIPEVILARGKTVEDVHTLAVHLLEKTGHVIVTKADEKQLDLLETIDVKKDINRKAGLAVLKTNDVKRAALGTVAVFAAGTSDIPVAEEARIILEELGCRAIAAYDIGIAGIHRVLPWAAKVSEEDVDVVIVVAGMEGALASVVKSMVDVPVIGVPTSVGYGYGGGGTSALMSMLQSCSPGITVVNIDNGFGAAAAAYLMCRRISKYKEG
ncbi:MAG TPA: nickel pincer cofactor biosynthesis protein LarB [Euryarchaeota archaeon]|nr:nickel pincer cofactor biosynthesis protein LarB [Euryarchaeota archaeon]